jgi:hypothetical protein
MWRVISEAWGLGPGPCLASRGCYALGNGGTKIMVSGIRRKLVGGEGEAL